MLTITNLKVSLSKLQPSCSGWHLSFEVPDANNFSGCVQEAIRSGVVTSKARREITQTLRTLIVQNTHYPTPDEYTSVCQKLVVKFPKLKDTLGSNGFVSTSLTAITIVYATASIIIGFLERIFAKLFQKLP